LTINLLTQRPRSDLQEEHKNTGENTSNKNPHRKTHRKETKTLLLWW